jgi:ubiquitin fusion degradation protein 1
MIQIKSTSLELAKLVKLQAQSVNFLEISDPRAVLEKAFRNFATLTKGDVFNFEYNDEVYDMAVLDVKPETEKMGVSMIETDVSVEFAAPLGYVEPERSHASGTSTPRSGRGPQLPAGGLLHSQGTMAQAINYDALASSASRPISNFGGEGQRLVAKKAGKASAAPAATASVGTTGEDAKPRTGRQTSGPMPLRLPPNKLFFGYEVKPIKTAAQREQEAADARQPHFAGQGQTLRGGAVKRKGEDADKGADLPEKKPDTDRGQGRRLDGRKVEP